jgi:2-Cys peroxiredoxin 5
LYENNPATIVNLHEYCKGKKIILFGVPGAFTPGCSKTHLPGYVADFDKLKAKGGIFNFFLFDEFIYFNS